MKVPAMARTQYQSANGRPNQNLVKPHPGPISQRWASARELMMCEGERR